MLRYADISVTLCPMLFATLGGGTAFAQAVSKQAPLAGRWRAGQSWHVEYLRPLPSSQQAPSPSPRPPERSIWKYQVMDSDTPEVRVEAVEEGGPGKFDLRFYAPLLTLRRVVRISNSRAVDLVIHSAQTPYCGWSQSYPLIFDWPALPQSKQAITREFTDDDGQHIAEVVRFTSSTQFEVVMTLRRTIDSGYTETRRSIQAWTVGSPWWSEASIQTESSIDGKKSGEINIRGRLIP
jgi:hypothetical protein